MYKEIEILEAQLLNLKTAYAREEAERYKRNLHKNFVEGDIVCCGDKIGIVGWTENEYMNLSYEDGYMGVNLLSGTRGYACGERRDDWELVTDPYYTSEHQLTVQLTGVEIETLKYHYGPRNCNPHDAKDKLYDAIDRLQATEGKQEGGGHE